MYVFFGSRYGVVALDCFLREGTSRREACIARRKSGHISAEAAKGNVRRRQVNRSNKSTDVLNLFIFVTPLLRTA